jgi:acetyl esterase/lipase
VAADSTTDEMLDQGRVTRIVPGRPEARNARNARNARSSGNLVNAFRRGNYVAFASHRPPDLGEAGDRGRRLDITLSLNGGPVQVLTSQIWSRLTKRFAAEGGSRNAFHPDLRTAARFLPRTIITGRTYRLIQALGRLSELKGKDDDWIRLGTASVLLYRPSGVPSGSILWIHGGGLTTGTAAQDSRLCRRLVQELGVVVASVKYRLAPESPYPAALNDCYTAVEWLANHTEPGSDNIVVAGSSAGGGLAAALAQMAYDRGEIHLAGQVLVYPMLDDRTAAKPDPMPLVRRLWSNRSNAFGWRSYLADSPGGEGIPPLVTAARRQDLSGLPPTWIGVGSLDLFHDESVAFADGLRRSAGKLVAK